MPAPSKRHKPSKPALPDSAISGTVSAPEGQSEALATEKSNGPARVLRTLRLKIPGSTSNLGPGLDTLGLALDIYMRVTFVLLDRNDLTQPIVTMHGGIAERSQLKDQGKLIYDILSELWSNDVEILQRLRIIIATDIPLGAGLGSRDAAIMAALWASYHFRDMVPSQSGLLTQGARLQGYPENLAASLMGDLVVCARSHDDTEVIAEQIAWPERWRVIAVVPPYTVSTQDSRAVLPKQVRLSTAVSNIQRSSLAVAAIANSNEAMLKLALKDELHEPYRKNLVPEFADLQRYASLLPIIGCTLSGGGSSIIILVNEKHRRQVVNDLLQWCQEQARPPSLLDLTVDRLGLRELPPE